MRKKQVKTIDINKMLKLNENLQKKIFGQKHIIDEVVDILSISAAGLNDESKPYASFLFTGPTGVGKTELAKELATILDISFVRFDMSEYGDEYSARNLTGGQKGLVGYEDGGLLTNAIAEEPYSVLLFDELEKAHPAVYKVLLQVLDYGTLTDTQGHKIDFTKTIIIFTSNLGFSDASKTMGFGVKSSNEIHNAVVIF